MLGASDQIDLAHVPGLCRSVVVARHLDLPICVCAKQNHVKLDISLVRVHLAIAVEDLEFGTDFTIDLFVGPCEGDSLIINDAIHDGRRQQEPPVDEQVKEEGSHDAAKLIVVELDQFAELLLSFTRHFVTHLVLCLIVVAAWASLLAILRL